jgi:hypothetical protein
MTRLIIADARTTTAPDFFRYVFGKPLTTAEKSEREAERRRYFAELKEQHQREMMELRRRILAQFSTEEGRAGMLASWAAEGVDCTTLTEVHGDPIPEDRRAA